MYVEFMVEDGTRVAVALDGSVPGWSDLAAAIVWSLNKCRDLARPAQIVQRVEGATIITPKEMAEWFRQSGVPF